CALPPISRRSCCVSTEGTLGISRRWSFFTRSGHPPHRCMKPLGAKVITFINRRVFSSFFLTVFLLLSVKLAPSQESRGQLLGRITDATGSVIVAARVQAVNTATGVETTAASNETGDYLLPFLMPGAYTLQ